MASLAVGVVTVGETASTGSWLCGDDAGSWLFGDAAAGSSPILSSVATTAFSSSTVRALVSSLSNAAARRRESAAFASSAVLELGDDGEGVSNWLLMRLPALAIASPTTSTPFCDARRTLRSILPSGDAFPLSSPAPVSSLGTNGTMSGGLPRNVCGSSSVVSRPLFKRLLISLLRFSSLVRLKLLRLSRRHVIFKRVTLRSSA